MSLGRLRYMLWIEGFPYAFCTDNSLENGISQDRYCYEGLSLEGCRIVENINLRECFPEIDSMTVRIKIPEAIGFRMFAYNPEPISFLTAKASESTTSFTIDGNGTEFGADDYAYIGTEVVQIGAASATSLTSLTRTRWDTLSQVHYINIGDNDYYNAYIYMAYDDSAGLYYPPPVLDNRRVYLIQYREGETPGAYGPTNGSFTDRCIYRGVIGQAPALGSDGVTWELTISPITSLFEQEICISEREWNITGIYHSDDNACAVLVRDAEDGTANDIEYYKLIGYWNNDEDFIASLNAMLVSEYSNFPGTYIDEQNWSINDNGTVNVTLHTNDTDPYNYLIGYVSSLEGCIDIARDVWWNDSSGKINEVVTLTSLPGEDAWKTSNYADSAKYLKSPYDENCIHAGRRNMLGKVYLQKDNLEHLLFNGATPEDGSNVTVGSYPSDRIYLESAIEPFVFANDSLLIETPGFDPILLKVDSVTSSSNILYVTVVLPYSPNISSGSGISTNVFATLYNAISTTARRLNAFFTSTWPYPLNSATKIQVIPNLTANGDLYDFMNYMDAYSIYANTGLNPFVTSQDMDISSTINTLISNQSDGIQYLVDRDYLFGEKVSFKDVLIEECRLYGVFAHLNTEGKVTLTPLQMPSKNQSLTTIDADQIVTPFDGLGAWPTWMPDREGIVNIIELEYGYDVTTGKWPKSVDIIDDVSVTQYKNRGRAAMKLKPYSSATNTPDENNADLVKVARRLLSFFASSYDIVEVPVTLEYMTTLTCGSYVSLTSNHLPDTSDGTKGVTNRPGVVVGREWPLDPSESIGKLRVRLEKGDAQGGYAPACYVSSSSINHAATHKFDLTVTQNKFAPTGENDSDYFSAGNHIMVLEANDATPQVWYGSITTIPNATTITIQLDDVFNTLTMPGVWYLSFAYYDVGLSEYVPLSSQQSYVYVSESTGRFDSAADKEKGDRFR